MLDLAQPVGAFSDSDEGLRILAAYRMKIKSLVCTLLKFYDYTEKEMYSDKK